MALTATTAQARDHCLAPSRTIDAPLANASKYGRMFPELPPVSEEEPLVLALGRSGGFCDGSAMADDPGCDDARGAAGWPLFGQFIAHDITADRSSLQEHADPDSVRNFRTPRANLECLYGAGQVGSPYLYDRDDAPKLLIGENDEGEPADVPRNRQGTALIGDPRNDVHLFVSQLHLAFLKVHNGLVDRLREDGVAEDELFDEAARATHWHYQWVIVHDFLPRLVGADLMRSLLDSGPRFYRPQGDAFIPFEFADGAYRYGHGQIRHSYRLNDFSGDLPLFPDLMGFRPVPAAREVDWSHLFEMPGAEPPQPAKKIDGRLARSLIELPLEITGDVAVEEYHSLAVRDLQRGHALSLPSGESVARAMGEQPLTREQVGLADSGWSGETPLWLYVLKEAEVRQDGERLGPVGGQIVAEVLLGIIDADPDSQRVVDPEWRPTLPSVNGNFELADLLRFASYR
ncbi:MAG TPA: heme peroxidase family protein [Thermoleophilaceae bacterium]